MSILLNPEGRSEEKPQELAPRTFNSLDGITLGLLGNSKLNADAVLGAVGDLLRERYAINATVARMKPSFSHPAPAEIMDELVAGCDVVLAGVGD